MVEKTKIAMVTGAGRSIGKSVCLNLAKEGSKVVAVSRTKKDLIKLKRELDSLNNLNNLIITLDLEKKASVKTLFNKLKKNKILPDIVVNNLGGNLGLNNPLGPVDEWRKVMRLNVEIAIEINRLIIPSMQKKKWGRICHLSSISALENQGSPSYCAAKSALNAYVRSVGRYVSKDNIIMTSVMSGPVYSKGNYWDTVKKNRKGHYKKFINERMAIKRLAAVEEISSIVSFLCSKNSSFCVGSCFLVDGGQGKVFYPSDF
tara:strand:+ start:494 stop:1273 length:780 start_codon:yes stop_codon:yes gene_type:complete